MKGFRLLGFVAVLCGWTSVDAASGMDYVATLLHPSGSGYSAASGVSTGYQAGYGDARALRWNGTPESVVDLNPPGYLGSFAYDESEGSQVGTGLSADTFTYHALLWNGTAASAVDLHPNGYSESYARGVEGGSQVGYGLPDGAEILQNHALLWHGSAGSVIDLNPASFNRTEAHDVWGGTQVGMGIGPATGNFAHALLWNGSAASVVDLTPSWAGSNSSSVANAIWENVQVGDAGGSATGFWSHAALWHGSAASAIDLNPLGFTTSAANGVAGEFQVGSGRGVTTGNENHALLWQGSAASVVDLHSYLADLPVQLTWSWALGVDVDGNIVGSGFDSSFNEYAILWTPVPEPTSPFLTSLGAGLGLALSRRRRALLSQCIVRLSAIPLLLAASTQLHAASTLVSQDLHASGDGLLTYDTATGLSYLDLTVTNGRSFDDVSSKLGPGQEFDGYRYATNSEIVQMFGNAGIPNVNAYSFDPANGPAIAALQQLVGLTLEVADFRISAGFTADPSGPPTRSLAILQYQISDDGADAYLSNTLSNDTGYGSWLVRAVPEPSSLFLLGSSAFMTLGVRRKRESVPRRSMSRQVAFASVLLFGIGSSTTSQAAIQYTISDLGTLGF